MRHPITEQNFRPLTSVLESGYTVSIELGDLVQDKQVWRDQAMRVTVVNNFGETTWEMFRGSNATLNAKKWLEKTTNGAVRSF